MKGLSLKAFGLQLARIDKQERLHLCEPVMFAKGWAGVSTVLRRACISGDVRFGAKIKLRDHFADVLDAKGDIIQTVALDRRSYAALKNKWMRCRVQRLSSQEQSVSKLNDGAK